MYNRNLLSNFKNYKDYLDNWFKLERSDEYSLSLNVQVGPK